MQPTLRQVKVLDEPPPLGDMPLAPLAATGRSEAELADAMAQRLLAVGMPSEPEAMIAQPRSSLTARLAALAALIRHWPRHA